VDRELLGLRELFRVVDLPSGSREAATGRVAELFELANSFLSARTCDALPCSAPSDCDECDESNKSDESDETDETEGRDDLLLIA